MIRAGVIAALIVPLASISAAGQAWADPPADGRRPLVERHLQTPRFDPPPPRPPAGEVMSQLWRDLTGPSGRALVRRALPAQGGTLWLALAVALLVAFDFRRPRHPRNVELLALLATGFLMFEIMRFFEFLNDPVYWTLMDWIFVAIMAVSVFLLGRALWRVYRPHADAWTPNVPRAALMPLALILLGLNVAAALVREPDDAGFYTNLGAQRLRERAKFPYGDPLLTSTPGAAYGPMLYAAHIPFQLALAPEPVNPVSSARPRLDAGSPYFLPPELATQLTTVAFHLAGVAALVVAGRRLTGPAGGWGLAALYCGSAYVMGVGGEGDLIGGMTFISHIAPTSLSLVALATLRWPALSGAALAASAATLFYPAFFVPAWAGYYWRDRPALGRFGVGFGITAALVLTPVLLLSQPAGGRSLVGTILQDTLGHQQDPEQYGTSPFGFWGQRDGIRRWLREPLVAGHEATSPTMLGFLGFVAASFWLARGRREAELALLVGALAIGSQLWKIHGPGVYVNWYYPFLLLGFFGSSRDAAPAARNSDR